MQNIAKVATGAILASLILAGIIAGTNASERSECLQWQKHATMYPAFFLAPWQAAQCNAHGVIIDAPIK